MGGKRFHSMNAMIIEKDGFTFFYSYRTLIAKVYPNALIMVDCRFNEFSRTTIKQLGRFLREYTVCDYLSVKEAYAELSKGGYAPEYTSEVYNCSAWDNGVTDNPVMFF